MCSFHGSSPTVSMVYLVASCCCFFPFTSFRFPFALFSFPFSLAGCFSSEFGLER
jgi:hypothetical protein